MSASGRYDLVGSGFGDGFLDGGEVDGRLGGDDHVAALEHDLDVGDAGHGLYFFGDVGDAVAAGHPGDGVSGLHGELLELNGPAGRWPGWLRGSCRRRRYLRRVRRPSRRTRGGRRGARERTPRVPW